MNKKYRKKNTNRKKYRRRKILLFISLSGIAAGVIIIILPLLSGMIIESENSKKISAMTSEYNKYDENSEEISEQLKQAEMYNKRLANENFQTEIDIWDYKYQLSFDGGGVMGYIEIPKINVKMLIYHGTDDKSLASGAGHIEGTSLPVGGASTHAVITAHSGLKTMKAFDGLRQLEKGDEFCITTLGCRYKYTVYDIETVLPDETDSLKIKKGEDLVTLVTCTPYGINDHRLLVHARRKTS